MIEALASRSTIRLKQLKNDARKAVAGAVRPMARESGRLFARFPLNLRNSRLRLAALAALTIASAGCLPEMRSKVRATDADGLPTVREGQSLRSIGEQALRAAEEFEDAGRLDAARALYSRAVWAFGYQFRLTGEEPLLLEAARDGLERSGGAQPADAP